jgi:hypothetical protein
MSRDEYKAVQRKVREPCKRTVRASSGREPEFTPHHASLTGIG